MESNLQTVLSTERLQSQERMELRSFANIHIVLKGVNKQMEREFQSTSALSIRCSIGIRSLISIDILTIMNGIQQAITTNRVRRVIRQVQNKEAGVRHRVVSIRISSIQFIDRVLSIPSLFTNRYPHPFPLLQRQSRTTPDELQVQFSLLV